MRLTALILAGGLGSRLRSKVSDRPKVMAMVAEKPFLSYLLDQLHKADIRDVILATGYMSDFIEDFYGHRYKDMNLVYSIETKALGTGGAIRNALNFINSDPVLILNGDSYCDIKIKDFLSKQFTGKYKSSIVLNEIEDSGRYATVTVDPNNKIDSFIEKSEKRNRKNKSLINAGIYCLERQLISEIEVNKIVSLEYDCFPNWISRGIGAYRTNSKFIDIGIPETYEYAETFFESVGSPV